MNRIRSADNKSRLSYRLGQLALLANSYLDEETLKEIENFIQWQLDQNRIFYNLHAVTEDPFKCWEVALIDQFRLHTPLAKVTGLNGLNGEMITFRERTAADNEYAKAD